MAWLPRMRWRENGGDSIARNLAGTLSGLIIGSVLLTSGTLLAFEMAGFRREMERQALVLADLVGAQSVNALAFDDHDSGREILSALRADEHVLAACLYGAGGKPFAVFAREGTPTCPSFAAESVSFSARRMRFFHGIEVDGEHIATLYLESDTSAFLDLFRRSALVLVAVLLGSCGLALLIARQLRRAVWHPIAELIGHSQAVAEGDLAHEVDVEARGEFAALAAAFRTMSERLRALLGQVGANTRAVSGAIDELRTASQAIERDADAQGTVLTETSESLHGIGQSVKEINVSVETLSEASRGSARTIRETEQTFQDVAANSEALSGRIEGTAASITEMSASIREISDGMRALQGATRESSRVLEALQEAGRAIGEIAVDGHQLSTASSEDARDGLGVVSQLIQGMAEVKDSFGDIQQAVTELGGQLGSIRAIVDAIDDIAESTSLLSLNAQIIAAQAGEQGRAFSVVADEVAELAAQTASSAKEIGSIVKSVASAAGAVEEAVGRGSERVAAGAGQSDAAGGALQRICDNSAELHAMLGRIRETAEGQGHSVGEVREALDQVLGRVDQIENALAEQERSTQGIAAATEALSDLGVEVRRAMAAQRVRGEDMADAFETVHERVEEILAATRSQASQGDRIDQALGVFRDSAEAGVQRGAALLAIVESLTERQAQLERELERFRT